MKIFVNNIGSNNYLKYLQQKNDKISSASTLPVEFADDYNPACYKYFPNINFEGRTLPKISLVSNKLTNTFKDGAVVTAFTELAGKFGTDYASVESKISQTLTPVLQARNLDVPRERFFKFSELVFTGLSPIIASYLTCLGLDETKNILEKFNVNKPVNYNDWDINTFGMFTAYGLDFDEDFERFNELKSNPNLPLNLIPWCIRFNLSDSQIQAFLQEKQNNHNISDEELLYCVANGLTSVPTLSFPRGKIGRYIDLRNKEYDYLQDNTVRGQGGKYYYSAYLVMKYVINDLTDEEINAIEQTKNLRRYDLSARGVLGEFSKLMEPKTLRPPVEYLSFFDILKRESSIGLLKQKKLEKKGIYGEELFLVRKNHKDRHVFPDLDKWGVEHPLSLKQVDIKDFNKSLKVEDFQKQSFKDIFPVPQMLDFSEMFKRKAGQPSSYYSFAKEELNFLNMLKYIKGMPAIKESLPADVWYHAHTNTEEKTFKVLQKSVEKFLGVNKTTALTVEPKFDVKSSIRNIRSLDDETVVYSSNELKYDSKSSILKFIDTNNGFEVKVVPVVVEDKKALLFLDDDRGYLVYKGAIFEIKEPYQTNDKTKRSLSSYANIHSSKQIPVLLDAIKFLPMNILNSDGSVVIGQGLTDVPAYTGGNKTTNDTKAHYGGIFANLKARGDLSVINILRIMPKDANISINPCITDGRNILYSISSEWKDAEGTKWQLRAHSTDLGYSNGNSKWVTRCIYKTEASDKPKYLYENNGIIDGTFDKEAEFGVSGGVTSEQSHIKIDSPIADTKSLLNNIYFQNIAHQISLNVEEVDLFKRLTSAMGIIYESEVYDNIRNIFQKLSANPELYAYNKADIDEVRKTYGYLSCD